MKKVATYSTYAIKDFLVDDDFIAWCKYAQNNAAWNEIIVALPAQQKNIQQAKEIIIALSSQHVAINNNSNEIWQNIASSIAIEKNKPVVYKLFQWRNIAASIIFIIAVAAGYYTYLHTSKNISTNYAATQIITLPDESVITLNRNSSLTYSRLWNANRSREVLLNGEAFFNIKHVAVTGKTNAADSFRVIVNNLRATVMGTQFNIRSRRGKTIIALQTGKLRIDFLNHNHAPVFLLPGEEFVNDAATAQTTTKTTDTSNMSAWKKQTLVLQGTSLNDIVEMLEDDYGYKVEVNDKLLLEKKLNGSIPMQNMDDLFFVLRNVLNVDVEQKDNTVIISGKTN